MQTQAVYTEADIALARKLGADAFAAGKMAAPALDSELMSMIKPGPMGQSICVLDAWSKGWHAANRAAPVDFT